MAAQNELYLRSYSELQELKQWAFAYYPKLFIYFSNWAFNVTEKEFINKVNKTVKEIQDTYKETWNTFSPDGTINCAIAYIMRQQNTVNNEEEARELAISIKTNANKTSAAIREDVEFPIFSAPSCVNRKLKWICPLPTVRYYLQKSCGVNEKWYYKLFWRGKKYFDY